MEAVSHRCRLCIVAVIVVSMMTTFVDFEVVPRFVFVVGNGVSLPLRPTRVGRTDHQVGATSPQLGKNLSVGFALTVAAAVGLSLLSARTRFATRQRVSCGTSPFTQQRISSSLHKGVIPHSSVACKSAAIDNLSKLVIDDEPTKPASDPRSYKMVELPNGLQVLLASDPTADASAAALTVRAGTFQDPGDRQGLAHFHEHMLFLGTEKYPKEDEYSKYLNEHGGDSNAFTMNEYTTYYFKVASPFLTGALDRFAQFFVSPTFDPACVEREMNAVDSESTNYSTEDGWRLQQVLKATAAEEHPFFRFDVGNNVTLGADDPQKTREEIIEWNQKYYQGGAMKLAIVGKDSLQDLEKTAIEQFCDVRGGAGEELKYDSQAWPAERLQRIVYALPLKESRAVSVCWPMPPLSEQLFAKPETHISHLLGHEGAGSLHDILNQLGWVDGLSAGTSQDFSNGQLFALNITLSPEGDQHRDEVLALAFEYVDMIVKAGPKEDVHKELVSLQEIGFAHQEDSPLPDNFAVGAAMSMHKYPPKEIFRGPYALDEWKPDVIQKYMDTLSLENSLVFITSSEFKEEAEGPDAAAKGWKSEDWYKAMFKEETFTEENSKRWKLEGVETGLRLPDPNPFIPQDFSLRGKASSEDGLETTKLPMEVTPPKAIVADPLVRIWHKTDCAFKTPRAYLFGIIHTKAYDASAESVMMMRLFCSVVQDDLNAYSYDAACAGLTYNVGFSQNISLSVGGFNDRLAQMLDVVLEKMTEVVDSSEEAGKVEAEGPEALSERGQELYARMETQRQIMLQDYGNFHLEEPYSVSSYYAGTLLAQGNWVLDEYIQELEKPASLGRMAKATRESLNEIQLEFLAHGNIDAEETKQGSEQITTSLKRIGSCEAMPEVKRRPVTMLPLGKTTVFEFDLVAKNPAQENCCTTNIYQVGEAFEDIHRDACVAVFTHICSNSAYTRLRTEEQLGYIVQGGYWSEGHVIGMQVIVQGPRMPPHEVDVRIEEWISKFGEELADMSDEDFAMNIEAVVSERIQRFATLGQESGKHWGEIGSRRYDWQRAPRAIEAFKALKKGDMVKLFQEYIAIGAPNRRKASMRILGTSANGATTPEGDDIIMLHDVEDIRKYQASGECTAVFPPEHKEIPADLLI